MSEEKSLENCISDFKSDFKRVFNWKDLPPVYGLLNLMLRTNDLPPELASLYYVTGIAIYQTISTVGGICAYVHFT